MEQTPHMSEPLLISDNRVQMRLAELAFRHVHGEVSLSRNEIMREWVTGHAAEYRRYVEDPRHADEKVNPEDPNALEEILKSLESETLH